MYTNGMSSISGIAVATKGFPPAIYSYTLMGFVERISSLILKGMILKGETPIKTRKLNLLQVHSSAARPSFPKKTRHLPSTSHGGFGFSGEPHFHFTLPNNLGMVNNKNLGCGIAKQRHRIQSPNGIFLLSLIQLWIVEFSMQDLKHSKRRNFPGEIFCVLL